MKTNRPTYGGAVATMVCVMTLASVTLSNARIRKGDPGFKECQDAYATCVNACLNVEGQARLDCVDRCVSEHKTCLNSDSVARPFPPALPSGNIDTRTDVFTGAGSSSPHRKIAKKNKPSPTPTPTPQPRKTPKNRLKH